MAKVTTKENLLKFIESADLNQDQIKKMLTIANNTTTAVKMNKNNTDNINNVDKNTDKYKLLLEFINKLLNNIDKDPITDLTDFKDIDRLDIIQKKNKIILDKMTLRLFKVFDKSKTGYCRNTDAIVLNCLRGLCKQTGLILKNKKKDVFDVINGKSYRSTHYTYSILL